MRKAWIMSGRWSPWKERLNTPVLALIIVAVLLACFLGFPGSRPAPAADTSGPPPEWSEPRVVFSPDPVKTGYEVNNDGTFKSSLLRHVIATVIPASARDSVTFTTTGATGEIEIKTLQKKDSDKWEFDVAGKDKTPVTAPNGDVTIQAKKGAIVAGSVQVIVVIPAAVGTPHPLADRNDGRVLARNKLLDAGSRPPAPDENLPEGFVYLATCYLYPLHVPVVDQFGSRLDSIYADPSVTVTVGNWEPTNGGMRRDGTYVDPVGQYCAPQVPAVRRDSTAALEWSSHEPLPLQAATYSQNEAVQVGGHILNPAIVDRTVTTIPPDRIQVIWP